MRNRITRLGALGVALSALAVAPAHAQYLQRRSCSDCTTCSPPCMTAMPSTTTPSTTPPSTTPVTPSPTEAPTTPAFAPEQAAAGGGEGFALDSGVGYIDSALIKSLFRLRYDSAYNANRPDRAEFLYPKCGCFRLAGLDPNAKGPPPGAFGTNPTVGSDTNVDYQEISAYFEYAFTPNISGFVKVPFRIVNFSIFSQEEGFGDINFGVKAALLACDDQVVTFQFRTYASTGMGDRGLGTQHVSLEPALLFYQRVSDKLIVEGEFRYWIPLNRDSGDGTPVQDDFKGDVIRYGIGVSYFVVDRCDFKVAPVAEFVGWSVLGGNESNPNLAGLPIQSAAGDTIVNAKLGVRAYSGKNDVYVGYGRALTGEVWYKDIVRLEYRRAF